MVREKTTKITDGGGESLFSFSFEGKNWIVKAEARTEEKKKLCPGD